MTLKDKDRFERLKKTLGRNYKITQLYASYLNNCPEAITKNLIDSVCSDSDITEKDAVVALLSELFGLDFGNGAEDRILIRQYITPSVRILTPKKYTENPYYKNVKIKNVTDGAWELKTEAYEPYRAVICDDIEIKDDLTEIPPLGFFKERFEFPAVLEDGNEWMTLTPVDMDTCEVAISEAHGKVVTFGLGLGYYAYMVSIKDDVDSITVIEKSPDVIRLFEKYIFPYFPKKDKVKVINADAFEYAEKIMPAERFDYAFVDTWRDASDGAPMYEKMKPLELLNPDTEFSYWISGFIRSRIRSQRYEKILSDLNSGNADSWDSYEKIESYLTQI